MESTIKFYDIYDYYYTPITDTLWFKIAVVIGILLLGFLIGYAVFRRRQRQQIAPWVWAQQEIQKLPLKKCTSKDDFKKFYFNLTGIIKEYLQRRYDWKTRSKTDTELITYLEGKDFDASLLESLKKMTQEAEWIKFANEEGIKTQAEKDLVTAQSIIKKTKESEKIDE